MSTTDHHGNVHDTRGRFAVRTHRESPAGLDALTLNQPGSQGTGGDLPVSKPDACRNLEHGLGALECNQVRDEVCGARCEHPCDIDQNRATGCIDRGVDAWHAAEADGGSSTSIPASEIEEQVWEALRQGRRSGYSHDVPLPRAEPAYVDRNLAVLAAELDMDHNLRPSLRLELRREYKTTAVVTSDGVVWSGEIDRLDPTDRERIEAWLVPHMTRIDAATLVVRRSGWFDPREFHRLTGQASLYPDGCR